MDKPTKIIKAVRDEVNSCNCPDCTKYKYQIVKRVIDGYKEWYSNNCHGTTPHLHGLEIYLDQQEEDDGR